MVEIETKLKGDLSAGLDGFFDDIKGKILLSGVAAMARVIYNEVKLNTSGVRKGGPGDPPGQVTGTLNKAIYRVYAESDSTDDRKIYRVSVNKRTAPHWHLVEFGTSRMAARPYIRPAFDRVPEAIVIGMRRMRERIANRTASGENE